MKNILKTLCLLISLFLSANAFAGKVKLSDRDTMSSQLDSVGIDNRYLRNKLHPLLLQRAGDEMNPHGIANMFTFAIYDATEDLQIHEQITVQMNLNDMLPQYVRAILPNNAEEASIIIEIMRQSGLIKDDAGSSRASEFKVDLDPKPPGSAGGSFGASDSFSSNF
jgi:hypothetical protein